MSTTEPGKAQDRLEKELRIQRQIGFASGLFQEEVTIPTVLESIAEGVVVVDEHGTILLVNTRTERMFGYSRRELVGQPHAMLISDPLRTVHEEHEAAFFREPKIRPMGQLLDLTGRRRDGSEFPVEISLGFIETANGILVLAFISDISLRKEYESRLKEGDELFRAQVECVKDYAVFMLDAQGNVLNWNAGAERLYGYQTGEIAGRHFSIFCPKEERDAEHPEELIERARTEGQAVAGGWRLRKDGSRFWADVIITALRDENGKLRGFSKVTHDITERRRAEEILRNTERKLRNIVENSTNLFYMHSIDHVLTYMSPQTQQFFDCEPEDALVRWTDFITDNPVNRAAIKATQRAIDTGERQPSYQVECIGRKGRKIWVEVNESPIVESGKTVAVVGSLTDITERKRAEEALLISEARYRALYRDNPTMIVTLDAGLTTLSVNPTCASQLGYTVDELEGRSVLTLFHEDNRPAVAEQLQKCLRNPGQVYRWQFRKVRKDGGLMWVEEIAQAVHDRNGALNILVVCQDVTERKRLEEEIEKLNTDLATRAAELEVANQELEAFNYTVAHDLRKPLTAINGYCQAIKELCAKHLSEPCEGYLQEAYEGTLRMNHLIDALLNFSCLARVEPRREKVDFSALAQEAAAELKISEPERRVSFRIADGITVEGDAGLLRVVLDNLFGNAWKYTALREEGIIEFGVTEVDGRLACFVRDNGRGFAGADAAKLFQPFQRLPGTEGLQGFGIGLATVERIIKRHGGRVWAEGEPGKGAIFFFTFAGDKPRNMP